MERNGVDFLIFQDAWKVMLNGGKVTNPDCVCYFVLVNDCIERHYRESGVLITRYDMIPYGFMKRDDWTEVKEEIPEVKIGMAPFFVCPKCKFRHYLYEGQMKMETVSCRYCRKEVKLLSHENVTSDVFSIKLPSIKVDTTLPKGTLYMRNDTAEKTEIVFGKLDKLECHGKWLQSEMDKVQKNMEYHDASDCLRRYCILDECLMELNKQD
jgi:hypothetical protein